MTASIETALAIGGTAFCGLAAVLAVTSLMRTNERKESTALVLLAGGAMLLLIMLGIRVSHAGGVPSFTRFDALAGYALALSGAYLLLSAFRYSRGIAGVLIPYVTITLLCGVPALGMEAGALAPVQGLPLVLHVLSGYAAFGVFTLASIYATVYLMQDSNLRHKRFGVVWERLPSLEILDHIMSRLVGLAFLLFSIAIIVGFMLVHRNGSGAAWFTDPKVGATVATWILLAVLVHMRASANRHGRGVAAVTVAGLVCLLFTFVGVHLIAHSVHAFLQIRGG